MTSPRYGYCSLVAPLLLAGMVIACGNGLTAPGSARPLRIVFSHRARLAFQKGQTKRRLPWLPTL